MNVPPVSVERVQKCVVNLEIYRFLKKSGQFTSFSPTSYMYGAAQMHIHSNASGCGQI